MKIRVALADDHPLVINGLYHVLMRNKDIEIIANYPNGKELLVGLAAMKGSELPDVLLLDIQMPGQQGDELAEIISDKYPTVHILALTNLDNVYYIKTMLRNGVTGYILKTTEEHILLDAIRAVSKGERYLEPALKEKLVEDSFQSKKGMGASPILSRREKEILQFISADLTSQEIADKLCISKRTVDTHRLNLLTKLGVKNVAAMVKRGIQLGLIE